MFGAGRRAELAGEVDRLGDARVPDRRRRGEGDGRRARRGARRPSSWRAGTRSSSTSRSSSPSGPGPRSTASGADVVVCVGGGSSTGLAKAIALTHGLPIVAVPTTYAGSEQTTIYGLTGGRHKQTGKDPVVLPRAVIYDPELTLGLPPRVTGPSSFNALAHGVEALYAPGRNPVTQRWRSRACGPSRRSLPRVMDAARRPRRAEPSCSTAPTCRAWRSARTSAGLHHKLSHVLGGTFDLVHADTHSVVLPHAVAFNAPALPDEMARLADALGVPGGDPAGALWDLAVASHVPTSLADLGLRRDDLAEAAERAAAEITDNPRPFTRRRPARPARAGVRRRADRITSSDKGEP